MRNETSNTIIQQDKLRTFLYDNSWWTIVIEFQPSAYSKGSYLNIGLDFNFYPRNYFAFTYGYREKEFQAANDETQFNIIISNYCDLIIKRVDELKLKFRDPLTATDTFKKQFKDDLWDSLPLGVLYGLTGNVSASKKHLEKVINSKTEYDYEIERQKVATEILDWTVDRHTFLSNIKDVINKTRQLKKLEPAFSI